MLNTAQDVYDIAIRLIDEQNDRTGETVTTDNRSYVVRTPSLLNSLLDKVYMASSNYCVPTGGGRPTVPKVFSMSDTIELDEALCTGVLPFGLAGLLVIDDPALSNYFTALFNENLAIMKGSLPAVAEDIENPYGAGHCVLEHGEFGEWPW